MNSRTINGPIIMRSNAPKGKKNHTAIIENSVMKRAAQIPVILFWRIQYPDNIRRLVMNANIGMKIIGIDSNSIPTSVFTLTSIV
jgi:hypothetical protein